MKILVTERIADEGIQYLRDKGFETDFKLSLSHEDILKIIPEYDAIIVRSVTQVNKEIVEAGIRLKVAGRAGNGIDNIDVPSCTQRGIIVV
ncbi:MAG: phosphoglycerate dehydrogenase, partial [Acidobacteria bacterium]|nr:phosphoglycerate dehydrogenase [Acidobacteriota bacterium]